MDSHSYSSTANQDPDLRKLLKHRHHYGTIGKLVTYVSLITLTSSALFLSPANELSCLSLSLSHPHTVLAQHNGAEAMSALQVPTQA